MIDKHIKKDNKHKKEDTEIEKLQKRCDEYLEGWKRAKADYLNYKKEVEKNQKEMVEFASAAMIVQIIPIYSNFKKAFEAKEQKNDDWILGIQQIKKQLKEFLNKLGITEIKTIGEKFNPEQHESISKEKQEGKKSDIIIKEVEPGYLLNDKVLMPAKVVISE